MLYQLLEKLARGLESLGLPYMLIGGRAGGDQYHLARRATRRTINRTHGTKRYVYATRTFG